MALFQHQLFFEFIGWLSIRHDTILGRLYKFFDIEMAETIVVRIDVQTGTRRLDSPQISRRTNVVKIVLHINK